MDTKIPVERELLRNKESGPQTGVTYEISGGYDGHLYEIVSAVSCFQSKQKHKIFLQWHFPNRDFSEVLKVLTEVQQDLDLFTTALISIYHRAQY